MSAVHLMYPPIVGNLACDFMHQNLMKLGITCTCYCHQIIYLSKDLSDCHCKCNKPQPENT